MEAQKSAVIGDKLTVPNTEAKVVFRKNLTLLELRRVQRQVGRVVWACVSMIDEIVPVVNSQQFVNYTKIHPVADTVAIARSFVDFLNTNTG